MKIEIKHRSNGCVLFAVEAESWKAAVELAVKSRTNLSGADLSGANLYGADLSGANLYGANLYGANLSRTDLSGAYLSRTNLSGAYLSRTNLSGADLSGANLSGANLYGADLSGANLSGANLYGANLSGAKQADLAIARTRILSDGDIIGWKKCKDNVIVKLLIPSKAKRSHAFGRKCRAEHVKVIQVIGGKIGISSHDGKTEYKKGKTVKCDKWNNDWKEECAGGIHFFITRIEAENYN